MVHVIFWFSQCHRLATDGFRDLSAIHRGRWHWHLGREIHHKSTLAPTRSVQSASGKSYHTRHNLWFFFTNILHWHKNRVIFFYIKMLYKLPCAQHRHQKWIETPPELYKTCMRFSADLKLDPKTHVFNASESVIYCGTARAIFCGLILVLKVKAPFPEVLTLFSGICTKFWSRKIGWVNLTSICRPQNPSNMIKCVSNWSMTDIANAKVK